jgi:Rod binding domain-containing protein
MILDAVRTPERPLPSQDELGLLARNDPRLAAKKFEGLLASMLLSEMRKTLPSGSFFGDAPGADLFDGLLDQTLGDELAEQGGFGLAASVEETLNARAEDLARKGAS